MTQQKALKRRVRARMAKTGERYTAARRLVLAKDPEGTPDAAPGRTRDATIDAPPPAMGRAPALDPSLWSTSDAAMTRATGRDHAGWFALLDAWGGTAHTHAETTAWLAEAHGAPGWWRQAITVDYQRSRGMRRVHEMASGFTVSATRTIAASPERVLAAFTDAPVLASWFRGGPMEPRPTRAKMTARFEWAEPPSRVVVLSVPKGADRTLLAVTHERIPNAAAAARLKGEWRAHLVDLKAFLERS